MAEKFGDFEGQENVNKFENWDEEALKNIRENLEKTKFLQRIPKK